ncbi:hypothetical protein PIB30_022281 [Stylosanthes scabra]|uniref:Uncharacterized protein n=1 Tax=Stylosanthes scabra TaxID=79078 RepID=A0ABU6TAR9_9FABA|nr:hypothetical protein [Stylosanthes scabra]
MDESRSFLLEFKLPSSSLSLYQFINSIFSETVSTLSLFSSDPLFSSAIAFCTLVFLYLPHFFWRIVFSPVLILTLILFISILRLSAIQNSRHESLANDDQENRASSNGEKQNKTESVEQVKRWIISEMGFESSSCFVEWSVKAPLEVIYEEGEEQEAERDPWLSRFYPESDSDSSSSETGEWESGRSIGIFWLDDEEEREGLIEIALDDGCKKKREMEFQFDEENLIEIDISLMRYRELPGEISCH